MVDFFLGLPLPGSPRQGTRSPSACSGPGPHPLGLAVRPGHARPTLVSEGPLSPWGQASQGGSCHTSLAPAPSLVTEYLSTSFSSLAFAFLAGSDSGWFMAVSPVSLTVPGAEQAPKESEFARTPCVLLLGIGKPLPHWTDGKTEAWRWGRVAEVAEGQSWDLKLGRGTHEREKGI